MPRRGRIQYEGAIYHVMDRGNRSESIFSDDKDRRTFLRTLAETCLRCGWVVHCYVLMGNHYHILLETPIANLSRGMRLLQGIYTVRYNTRHQLKGHLFQGRYKAVVVEASMGRYFRALCDYIHLNPVRAGLIKDDATLLSYEWSSFPYHTTKQKERPSWLRSDSVLGEMNLADTDQGRARYQSVMEDWTLDLNSGETQDIEILKEIRENWYLGTETFRDEILQKSKEPSEKPVQPESRNAAATRDELHAEDIVLKGLVNFKMTEEMLKVSPKNMPEKIAMACVIRSETTVTNRWIGLRLGMGAESRVSKYCRPEEKSLAVKNLEKKLTTSRSQT